MLFSWVNVSWCVWCLFFRHFHESTTSLFILIEIVRGLLGMKADILDGRLHIAPCNWLCCLDSNVSRYFVVDCENHSVLFPVPSWAHESVAAHNPSSTSLVVNWSQLPKKYFQGQPLLLQYYPFWRRSRFWYYECKLLDKYNNLNQLDGLHRH